LGGVKRGDNTLAEIFPENFGKVARWSISEKKILGKNLEIWKVPLFLKKKFWEKI
jgi:hypothetical protein